MTRAETTHRVTMPAIRHVDVPDYPAASCSAAIRTYESHH